LNHHAKNQHAQQSDSCKVVKRVPSAFDGQHDIVARRLIQRSPIGIDVGLGINDVKGKEIAQAAEGILQAVSKHFGLKLPEIRSNTRARPVARPRQIAMYLIRKYTGLAYKEIGDYFGGKDHSTVHFACKKIETSLDTDPELKAEVEAVQNSL
jgi:chromosomal replication initiation ATPase DnaA